MIIVKQLNIGTPGTKAWDGKEISTAYFKTPVAGPLHLGPLGFTGDVQVSPLHGGEDRAALLYAADHFPYWSEFLGRPIGSCFLGENLTVAGLTEETACIGDIYRVGAATVQVSQPRVPCVKINMAHETHELLRRVIETGWTGIFVRVLTPGLVAAGDRLELVSRVENAPTVARVNQVFHHEYANRAAAEELLQVEALAPDLRRRLERRLAEA